MGHVDALSRNSPVGLVSADEVDMHLQATQSRDPLILELRKQLENQNVDKFELQNGPVYRKVKNDQLLLYVPFGMETNVIRLIHEKIVHLGV